mmetsp:Transcript_12957/g.36336  ORF Transcript_12957/g.36336 Transcript_12957/m.36336 type:complete len:224 (-) Transcript_12957:152-823(-)
MQRDVLGFGKRIEGSHQGHEQSRHLCHLSLELPGVVRGQRVDGRPPYGVEDLEPDLAVALVREREHVLLDQVLPLLVSSYAKPEAFEVRLVDRVADALLHPVHEALGGAGGVRLEHLDVEVVEDGPVAKVARREKVTNVSDLKQRYPQQVSRHHEGLCLRDCGLPLLLLHRGSLVSLAPRSHRHGSRSRDRVQNKTQSIDRRILTSPFPRLCLQDVPVSHALP